MARVKSKDRVSKQEALKRFGDQLLEGLSRKSIRSCSAWAEQYRVMNNPDPRLNGPMRFKYYPWLKGMHDCTSELVVGQKASQVGYSETLLNRVFYINDIYGGDALYVLPARSPHATEFTASRFNPALESSAHLRNLYSKVDNVGHKRAGTANLFIRGSRSKTGLKSISTGFVVLDEVEEMDQNNIPLAFERTTGQLRKEIWMVSTPSSEGVGINRYYQRTDQGHFLFKCQSCSKFIEFKYPDSIEIVTDNPDDPNIHNSRYRCYECDATIPHLDKWEWLSTGLWVPQFQNKTGTGFYINQMYSPQISAPEFAQAALRAITNDVDEQVFFNSKLGMTHAVKGASVSDADITNCMKAHTTESDLSNKVRTMGIDVGSWLHYVILEWTLPKTVTNKLDPSPECVAKLIRFGKVKTFEELNTIVRDNTVKYSVIDANPERRASYSFCMKNFKKSSMCYYVNGASGRFFKEKTAQDEVITDEPSVCVDRTAWLDLTLSRFRNKTILLPSNIDLEFRENIKSLTKQYKKDREGNVVVKYVKKDDTPDHYAHACNYAEIAFPFAIGIAANQFMTSKV